MREYEFEMGEGNEKIAVSDLTKSAFLQFVHFSVAAILSATSVQPYFSPLGLSFCSGTNRKYTFFSCLGAMLGYIVTYDFNQAFRYVMALILVYTLKIYTNSFVRLRGKAWVGAVCSLFVTLSTGIAFMIATDFTLKQIFMLVAETTSSFGGAFVFSVGFLSLDKLKGEHSLTVRELTFLLISLLTIVLSASDLTIFGVSIAGAVCSYVIMSSAYLFREGGGAAIGTGAALGFALTGLEGLPVFCYAAAGLFSGLFSYSGRVLCAFAYIFSYGTAYLYFSDEQALGPLIETAIASILFIITPHKFFIRAKTRLSVSAYSGEGSAIKNMVLLRLRAARDALGNMSGTVAKVSEILKEKAVPDTTGVYLRVRDGVCTDCASYQKCWAEGLPGTLGEFDAVIEEIRKTGSVTPSFVPQSLQSRCIRTMSLCDSFNKNYSSYSARLGAEGRINEMRKITADQFDTVCEMLDDLLVDFEKGARVLAGKSEALKNSLEDIGADAFVNCYEDEDLNMYVNMSVSTDCKVTAEEIKECIERVTEREFSSPAVITGDTEKNLMFWEIPLYSAECIYHQLSSAENEICGDCFDSFFDGKGNFIALLSDGMGTGSRAAIDGAMTASLLSRLIVSGFSFPCALRLVNSAMLVKSRDESLATLDILKINLYNGQSVIYKAGAAVSLLYRNGKVSEIKKSAMPIGILRQAEFATVRGGLKEDDVLIMMSDGAADSSLEEIKAYITQNGFSYDLPEKLCAIAKGRNITRHDDITVAVVKIKINEE